jgi:two-component system, NarL family, invasion response regulator UvrY
MSKVRVMLVDDHMIVRAGVRRLLESNSDFDIVGEADSGETAYELFGKIKPDITLMDINMPGMGGIESMTRILHREPSAKIIILSMYEHTSFVTQAMKAGAKGYLTKSGLGDELIKAIRNVSQGRIYMSASVAQNYAVDSLSGGRHGLEDLNVKEFEIFRLIAQGKDVEEIADALKLSTKTIANYQSIIKKKLSINHSIDIVKLAMQHGIIEKNQ